MRNAFETHQLCSAVCRVLAAWTDPHGAEYPVETARHFIAASRDARALLSRLELIAGQDLPPGDGMREAGR